MDYLHNFIIYFKMAGTGVKVVDSIECSKNEVKNQYSF